MSSSEAKEGGVSEEELRRLLGVTVQPRVKLSGIARTHPSVLAKDLQAIEGCRTVEAVALALAEAKRRWLELGVFRDVDYTLHAASEGPAVDVDVAVVEARARKSLGVYTTDTSLPEVTLSLENVLGGRYSLKGNYIPPASRVHALSLSLLSCVPRFGRDAEYYLGRRTESKSYHPASAERIEEAKAVARSARPGLVSEWSVGLQRRTLTAGHGGLASVPPELRADFVATDKNYIRHERTRADVAYHAHPTLYNMYPLPICGSETYTALELAGGVLGGCFSFVKGELQVTRYWPFGPFVSAQASARVAGVCPLLGSRVALNDRLFLSNCHVRGYKAVGPSTLDTTGCGNAATTRFAATGGNALWAASLSLNFPFPLMPNNGVAAMHLFANAGHVRLVDSPAALGQVRAWLRDCACSVGAGIVIMRIPLLGLAPSGRFELNFAVPVGVNDGGRVVLRNGHPGLFDRLRFGLV